MLHCVGNCSWKGGYDAFSRNVLAKGYNKQSNKFNKYFKIKNES